MPGQPAPPAVDEAVSELMARWRLPGVQVAFARDGRVIEHVSHQGYADFVQTEVLRPAGIEGMRLGQTRAAAVP